MRKRIQDLLGFALTAGVGSMALVFGKMFSGGTGFWDLPGGATQTIFQGGTLAAPERAARAAYTQASKQYRGTVLAALENVTDTAALFQALGGGWWNRPGVPKS